MTDARKTSRFNFLLTHAQKEWLVRKATSFNSCGDIVRNLIQQAMDDEHNEGKST
jgi:hypothetical protein